MNFQQLIDQVYIITKRPDMIEDTQQAVFASTLKMHGLDFFYKDIASARLAFDAAAWIQTIDTRDLPRFRAISYIRKWDPSFNSYQLNPTILPPLYNNSLGVPINSQLALGFLRLITPDDILDEYNTEKVDVCYAVGGTIMIKSSTQVGQAMIGWYQWPFLDQENEFANYSSWVADEFPFAIIYDAASAILQTIGMTDTARKYDQVADPRTGKGAGLVWSHINNLLTSNILAKGY